MDAAVAAVRARTGSRSRSVPASPATFLHALGERDDFEEPRGLRRAADRPLRAVHQAGRPPALRLLRPGRAVPARLRRRTSSSSRRTSAASPRSSRRFHPRVVAAAVSAPDADGWMSLSLHSGAAWYELQRVIADPGRIVDRRGVAPLPAHLRARTRVPAPPARRRGRLRRETRPRALPPRGCRAHARSRPAIAEHVQPVHPLRRDVADRDRRDPVDGRAAARRGRRR